jgi:hypothetical protein
MRKMIKRVLISSSLFFVVTFCGLLTIIMFPKPLFANTLKHGQFVVHSNSEIDANITTILDDATDLIRHSELYDPTMQFDVYLSYNTLFDKIDDALIGHGPSARATNKYVTIKVAVDVKKNLFFPTYYQRCQGNLTYLLTHELVHVLQESKYGKLKFNPFTHPEYWKLEGYPEYIARRPARQASDYDLASQIDTYMQRERTSTDMWMSIEDGGCKVPNYYYRGRLMTAYLMDIKHLSYDQILEDTTSENTIFSEMIKWRESARVSAK